MTVWAWVFLGGVSLVALVVWACSRAAAKADQRTEIEAEIRAQQRRDQEWAERVGRSQGSVMATLREG